MSEKKTNKIYMMKMWAKKPAKKKKKSRQPEKQITPNIVSPRDSSGT